LPASASQLRPASQYRPASHPPAVGRSAR
jgi:hypothetical protein